jgi:hypothetical protein
MVFSLLVTTSPVMFVMTHECEMISKGINVNASLGFRAKVCCHRRNSHRLGLPPSKM